MRKLILSLALVSTFSVHAEDPASTPAPVAPIAPANEMNKETVSRDKKELAEARSVRNDDQKRVEQDRQQLKQDLKSGASKEKIAADRELLKQDRIARHKAQKEVNKERRELKRDHKEGHSEHKG